MSEALADLVEETEDMEDPKSDDRNGEEPKERENYSSNQANEQQIEDANIYSTDSDDDEETNALRKKGDVGVGSMKLAKPSVEDRALQAILAERRRSLEMAKLELQAGARPDSKRSSSGKPVPIESEEIQAARNPMKWLADINCVYERSKRDASLFNKWAAPSLIFEAFRELEHRDHLFKNEAQYISQIKIGTTRRESVSKTISNKLNLGDGTKFIIQRSKPPPPKSDEDNTVKNRIMNTKVHLHLSRELRQKKRLLGYQGKKEIYTDKDRAAAVTLGDQDIKTSLKVKQKSERKIVVPEDMDANVYLTEAQKNLSLGNHKAALICACKAVNIGGPEPQNLLMRGRCFLLLGKLNEALEDAQNALEEDPSLVKALLVQAEALYTMGEFERALVLFHRGHRRRPDLSAFQKGINKAREAILNAIGGGKFPKAKVVTAHESALKNKTEASFESTITRDDRWKSSGGPKRQSTLDASNAKELERQKKMDSSGTLDKKKKVSPGKIGGHDSSQKIEETQKKITPLITEIKTSKMASKRLLGGLSSDKEFLHKLLSRGDLSVPKFRVNMENSRQGRRKSSVAVESEEEPPGSDVVSVAKEALTSLQYLEAFLWQRDPDNLSVEVKRKQSIPHRPKIKKKTSKMSPTGKSLGSKSESKKTKKQTATSSSQKKKEVYEKVSNLIKKLRESESLGSMKPTLAEAENYVDELRLLVIKSEAYAPCLVKLLTAIGKVLPRDNRGEDGIAVLRDASQIAKARDLVEEYYQASDALGHVTATEGLKDEAVAIWESLNDCRQSIRSTEATRGEKYDNSEADNNNEEVISEHHKNINEDNSEEVDSGVDARA